MSSRPPLHRTSRGGPREVADETLLRTRRVFEACLGVPFTDGNRVEVLKNGVQIFPAMLDALAEAQDTVDMVTFIYWKGDIARRFAHALAECARRGVRVRLLLDAVGSIPMPEELVELMVSAGVAVRRFRPLPRFKVWKDTHRTHRKVLVCDGRVAFTGGVGIAEEWEGDARDETEWRDTHVRITGPAVHGLQACFLDNWLEAGAPLQQAWREPPPLPQTGNVPIQVLRVKSAVGWSDATTAIQVMLVAARERVRIATAYFVPGELTMRLLLDAVARGVEVDVLVPGEHHDKRLSQLAGQQQYRPLLEGGVRLWHFAPTMMHAKVVTVDRHLAFLGSCNFNQRSMVQDDEIAIVALDGELTATLDGHFEEDLERSQRVTNDTWDHRGPWQRLGELVGRVFRRQT